MCEMDGGLEEDVAVGLRSKVPDISVRQCEVRIEKNIVRWSR